MECKNCGYSLFIGAKKCPNCGELCTEMLSEEQLPVSNIEEKKVPIFRADTIESYNFYFRKKFVYLVLAVVTTLIILTIVISALVSIFHKTDVTKYIEITAVGYEGNGNVSYSIDEVGLMKDIYGESDIENLTDEQKSDFRMLVSKLKSSIMTNSKIRGLSNGDVVTYTINNMDKIVEKTDIKIKSKNKIEYKVTELKNATKISLSDLFNVSFVGSNGLGYVELQEKSDSLPFPITTNSSYFTVDSSYRVEFTYSGNLGSLSNGDVVEIGLSSLYDSDYFMSEYGCYISDDKEEFTVEGLKSTQELDIFSLVDIQVVGVNGEAKIQYKWNADTVNKSISGGELPCVVTDSESSSNFEIYTVSRPNDLKLYIKSANSNDVAYSSQRFSLYTEKTYNISGGDKIHFVIRSGYDNNLEKNSFANFGYTFKEVEYDLQVDNSKLDKYITSAEQMDKEVVKTYGEAVQELVEEYLKNNWSSIVHGSSSFKCYDQTITSTELQKNAYFARTSSYSNSYKLWYIYNFKVKDSELDKEKSVTILIGADEPVLRASDKQIYVNGKLSFTAYEKNSEAVESLKYYQKDDSKFSTYSFS